VLVAILVVLIGLILPVVHSARAAATVSRSYLVSISTGFLSVQIELRPAVYLPLQSLKPGHMSFNLPLLHGDRSTCRTAASSTHTCPARFSVRLPNQPCARCTTPWSGRVDREISALMMQSATEVAGRSLALVPDRRGYHWQFPVRAGFSG
jgi:hypothetical protein